MNYIEERIELIKNKFYKKKCESIKNKLNIINICTNKIWT